MESKLLCVNCVDDPLTYVLGITSKFTKNPNIILALVEWGGTFCSDGQAFSSNLHAQVI